MIKTNFDFVQTQFREDYEKQDLVGYETAFECVTQFVENPHRGAFKATEDTKDHKAFLRPESRQFVEGVAAQQDVYDFAELGNDTNYPLIVTGSEGCGKTHMIIKWLMRFN